MTLLRRTPPSLRDAGRCREFLSDLRPLGRVICPGPIEQRTLVPAPKRHEWPEWLPLDA